ncbi:50S ribosomal protein L25/general stress protein Ctc [Roseisolibacter sp. H3M3-2]|uniref:50S ribosomal protein L25/general stress protein Ctc n=1 Tax=Roseisolibacter sp. H3M3-2 TaxID=3031323 RepID=UPI0023DC1860|nr:50S ribosomal protein L25/general stress protein Ctc [Roseisolibacter sp. H3M3-2]MDF1505442.1 50S ribosomal protein L25/general stress protein Ctc [Roseisolibacter sp. H3M3-2]
MATASLGAERRSETGKGVARKLRAAGRIPAVVYGHNRAAEALTVDARELERLLGHISAASTVVELGLGGGTARTLIREIQRHPVKRTILHVDFQELVAGERVTVSVPLVFVGTAPGVREQGGIFEEVLRELSISADPSSIPNHIDVDISKLTIGHPIHVRDLQLPSGATALTDGDATVCSVAGSKSAASDADAAATAEPEVIRQKKAEE